mgnify:CR=1 FL=1
MKILFITNYKRKIFILCFIFTFWVTMYLLSEVISNNSLVLNITINNDLTFSYPFALQVDNIYFNEQLNKNYVETNSTFNKPSAQKFSSYNSIKGKFSFNYPSILTLSQQDFTGSDILYHVDFYNKSKNAHGFVQVWNLPYPVKEFLDKSKAASTQNYKYFEEKSVSVNNLPGYYWTYSSNGNDGKVYKGNEVFLQKNNRMYRISYFVPDVSWDKSQSNIFWSIVNSFKTY